MGKRVRFQIQGGVGNQLFGYFAAKYFEVNTNTKVVLDKSQLSKGFTAHNSSLDDFNVEYEVFESTKTFSNIAFIRIIFNKAKILRRLFRIHIPTEVGFDSDLLNYEKYKVIRGYFQTYKYFDWLKKEGKFNGLELKNPSSWYIEKSNEAIVSNPIVIHFRLGDYKLLQEKYGILNTKYYLQALQVIRKQLPISPIWIFSDEPNLIEPILDYPEFEKAELIYRPPDVNDSESLMLMSKGAAIVIANSSYSWWAAKLSSNGCIIIAPSKWYQGMKDPLDLIPEDWTKIESSWRVI